MNDKANIDSNQQRKNSADALLAPHSTVVVTGKSDCSAVVMVLSAVKI